jgi:uncharacterized membrane protein
MRGGFRKEIFMIRVEKSIIINKPVEEVFGYITAEGSGTKWQTGVVDVIDEGPRNNVGSRYTEVRKFMGQEMRSTMELTEFVPNTRYAGKVIKGPVPYEYIITFDSVDGGTRMTTRVDGEPKGFFKLAENMVAAQLEKSLTEDQQKLKEILEKS